jgi:NTP pyrophosphatase (non-canonical NTP hydrolase)
VTFDEYARAAARTMSPETRESLDSMYNTAALGLAGEAGEFAEHIKKYLYHGHDLSTEYLRKEIGDILWYCAIAALACGSRLETIAEENIKKLQNRYPEKFNHERSKNRGE